MHCKCSPLPWAYSISCAPAKVQSECGSETCPWPRVKQSRLTELQHVNLYAREYLTKNRLSMNDYIRNRLMTLRVYIYGWQVKHVESIWILSISRSKFPNLTVRCSRKVIHPVATRIGLRGWTGCLHSRTERRSGQLGLKASFSSSYCWWPSLCRTPFSWSHKQMPCSWWRGNCVLATRLLWWVKIRTGFWGNCWL